jgi:endo-1,4-beta-xylanase
LRASADERGFYIGAAVAVSPFRNEAIYQDTLRREFNIIVAENAFKWTSVHPSRTNFNFTDTDALVDFAQANNMRIRGHTLVWHNQIPDWLTSGNFSRDDVIAILREHILTLVGRYRGRVWVWDVVNEAIDDSTGALRTSSFWYQKIGPEYIRLAFEFAREADPDARLYYNDYSAEGLSTKSNGVYSLVSNLKSQGVPIDGVGWQMHQVNGFRIQPANVTNARRLADLGLEISITEMDVRINLPDTAEKLAQQSDAYRDAINFCLTQPNCKALLMWGFTDKYSWIPGTFAGWGDALILDMSYQPKPAYFAIKEVLEQGVDLSPKITGASVSGKALFINGERFEEGAGLFINGEKQRKVSNDSATPSTAIVAKKSGKLVKSGDILQVRNPDGLLSNQFIYP